MIYNQKDNIIYLMIRLTLTKGGEQGKFLLFDFFDILARVGTFVDYEKDHLSKQEIEVRILLSRISRELIFIVPDLANCDFIILARKSPCQAYKMLFSLIKDAN